MIFTYGHTAARCTQNVQAVSLNNLISVFQVNEFTLNTILMGVTPRTCRSIVIH